MSTARSKKQDSLQELKTGTVQRLSQQFLQSSQHTARSSTSPLRYQPLTIPLTFMTENCVSSSTLSSSSSISSDKHSTTPLSPMSPMTSIDSKYEPVGIRWGLTRQQSAPQLLLQPASPSTTETTVNSPPAVTLQPPPQSSVGFVHSKSVAGGLSSTSVASDDSFVSALSNIGSPKEPGSPRTTPLWKQMLDAIEQEDRQELDRILHAFDFAIVIQTLVTWNLSNTDNQYKHDQDVLLDAKELLGPTVDHLNLIQIACFLFNEEMALDLLNFVAKASEELESKKILYEFMGKMWGDGNTTLHLASFLGMADLTKRLLDLGANVYKMNDRKYKPVDCADENTTKVLFLNLTEVVRYRRIGQESLPTSPINDSGSDFNWGSFKSLGHMRSPSTSTLPLSMMASEDYHPTQYSEGSNGGLSLIRPASTLGITSQLCGPLITETIQSNQQQQQQQNQHQKTQAAQGARQDASDGLQRGSSGFIEDLLLTESRPSQESGDDEESILSPMILTKPEASLTSISSASTPTLESSSTTSLATTITTQINMKPTEAGESISAKDSAEQTKPVDSHLMPLNTSILPTCAISSYVSHIRPKLRSYQSSPSIRLYVETSVSKESASTSKPKKSHNTKKVSFEPRAVMADASRMGDLELYKSMLEILLEDKEEDDSEALEEIINHQSASRKLSSLHLAASYNHLALCQFLVERGANVNLSDMEGWTPMHCAAAEGHLEVFEFLVKEPDADLQATTFDGELLEDVVEDDDLRQRVIDIIEAQPRA